jgi:hypothetical protein
MILYPRDENATELVNLCWDCDQSFSNTGFDLY